jgi:hypothetical protein
MAFGQAYGRESVATHIPLLTRVFDLSHGDVLEVGTGYFSTLLLHWLATIYQRHVYSYESKEKWYLRAQAYEGTYHHIMLCEDWPSADFDQRRWGLAFVDHSPGWRRPVEVARLANLADYIVIHDTEPEREGKYKFASIWGEFKYRYDYTKIKPITSVVSNFHDLSNVA